MPTRNYKNKQRHYRKHTLTKSPFDGNPTLIVNEYLIPAPYKKAVGQVIAVYRSGIPFNRAVDQIAASYPNINRNKLAEHTLKYIANEY